MTSELIRIKSTSADTLRELSRRTRIDMTELLDMIFGEVQKQLDLMESDKRLLFMADFYNRDNHPKVIIRLSDALMSSFDEMPPEIQSKVLESFSYKMVDGHIVDTTEKKPEQPQKLSHTEQIQKLHDEDVKKESESA